MVFSVPAIHRTFLEIVQQLRTGSAHCDSKHENKYTVALMRYMHVLLKLIEFCYLNWLVVPSSFPGIKHRKIIRHSTLEDAQTS